jgi:hypothetical protein
LQCGGEAGCLRGNVDDAPGAPLRIFGNTAWVQRKTPKKFVSITARKTSIGVSSTAPSESFRAWRASMTDEQWIDWGAQSDEELG